MNPQSLSPPGGLAPLGPADLVFDVTEADFRATVLERSLDVPVLLDCWAPWCAPCRSLTPILEKVVQSLGGRVVLAKLNTDEAPQISAALQMRSIPLVVLFAGGRPVDQFTGALPEQQVRAFLDKHLGPQVSEVDAIREEAKSAPDPQTAEALLREALSIEPGHVEATLDLVELWLGAGALDDAAELLGTVPAADRNDRHAALGKRLELAKNRPQGDAKALAARIASNSKDHEARFGLAAILAYEGDFNAAFDHLLEVVLRDKGAGPDSPREKARVQLVEWFAACPDAEAVSRGRRYLGMYLN